jgi:hypothetical protein
MHRGKYFVHGAPLSAVNEQLTSETDPWLLWVREYLRAGVNADREQVSLFQPYLLLD